MQRTRQTAKLKALAARQVVGKEHAVGDVAVRLDHRINRFLKNG